MGRYSGTNIKKASLLPKQKRIVNVYETTIYPQVTEKNDDLHLIASEGDRLDNIAQEFYGDPHLWWYLAKANHLKDMNVPAGIKLRIPARTDI